MKLYHFWEIQLQFRFTCKSKANAVELSSIRNKSRNLASHSCIEKARNSNVIRLLNVQIHSPNESMFYDQNKLPTIIPSELLLSIAFNAFFTIFNNELDFTQFY